MSFSSLLKGRCQSLSLTGPGTNTGGDRSRSRGARDLGECDALDPVRMIGCQRIADREARVVAEHGEPLVTERLHQGDQVRGEGAGVVAALGLVGQPDPALIDRDDLEVTGERRHQLAPRVPELGPAVDQEQRRALAAGDGVQSQLARVDVAARERVGEAGRRPGAPVGSDSGPSGVGWRRTLSS